jgi:hydrogenase nickel incorporation protein HypB
LQPVPGSALFIENVGNLVYPALFDLGEGAKVLVASVTERDDNVDRFCAAGRAASRRARILRLSATCGDGLAVWSGRLRDEQV